MDYCRCAVVVFILGSVAQILATTEWDPQDDEKRARIGNPRGKFKPKRREKANIVLLITDDQDVELGSLNYMPKTRRILKEGGAEFTNGFVTTPMCCPSRSSMLTGMYTHNHNTYTNNDNCSSVQWQQTYETRNFGTYLSNAGYRTGYFGKYLNEYQGTYIPPGWSEWVGLIRNSRFYNYSLNFNGKKIKHGDNYYKDYLTDLIANDSVTFLKQSKQYFPNRPVGMVLSFPAPHGPEDAAPQYQHMFPNVTTHRTPSWNFAPNPDKQWLLQHTGKMEPIHIQFTDQLQRKRLQTLQSVDDAVEKIYLELKELGELENTYIFYTSDHGYHLGQYGLVKGKAMPYDFDIRVPFMLRGPRIPRGVKVPNIALNIDLAPTILDIAGVEIPGHMDGRSLLKIFDGAEEPGAIVGGTLRRKKAWRDTFLVERGKITKKKMNIREQLEGQKNNLVQTKNQRLKAECDKPEYQPPCIGNQQWECKTGSDGRLRIYKCRSKKANLAIPKYEMPHRTETGYSTDMGQDETLQHAARGEQQSDEVGVDEMGGEMDEVCHCPKPSLDDFDMNRWEKKRQRQFLRDVVNQPKMLRPKFLRSRRHLGARDQETPFGDAGILQVNKKRKRRRQKKEKVDLIDVGMPDVKKQRRDPRFRMKRSVDGEDIWCQVMPNNTVVCQDQVYESFDSWKEQKNQLDQMIHEYKERLDRLKDIRKHLKHARPEVETFVVPDPFRPGPSEPESDLNTDPTDPNNDDFDPSGEVDIDLEAAETQGQIGHGETTGSVDMSTVTSSLDPEHDLDSDLEDEGLELLEESDLRVLSEEEQDEEIIRELEEREDYRLSPGMVEAIVNEGFYDPDCSCNVMDDQGKNERRLQKMKQRLERAERKKERRKKKKEKKDRKGRKKDNTGTEMSPPVDPNAPVVVTKDCNSRSMKCFSHDNDHWKTPPLWNSTARMRGRISARKDPMCSKDGLECTRMDNDHWRTEPRWRHGPFCFCPNSNNNTYWCLRTINDTHNYIYCEFITGFISFYDFIDDPYQLQNVVHDLEYSVLTQLHDNLEKMKGCQGYRECTTRTRPAVEAGKRRRADWWEGDDDVTDNETSGL